LKELPKNELYNSQRRKCLTKDCKVVDVIIRESAVGKQCSVHKKSREITLTSYIQAYI